MSSTAETRPDPDRLLAHVQAEEARAARGRLRIFFGSSAGVGKTYSMLEAARSAKAAGTDVVIGYLEPHGRVETERLAETLERLPPLPVAYRGIVRHEFNLDAALARHPGILLVDELAHSNLTGGDPAPRHPKRWQDIEELLAAGISVWTTVNVQHLESLNDLVYQTTGVRQRETLPDKVFDEADDIELIDLPPDDLIARLRAGKVYIADEVATAVERFFRKQNLMALREIALRRVADRVEAASRALAPERARTRIAGDRILVAVGPDAQAEQLVRAGKRMADALDAQWTVVYVETLRLVRLSDAGRNRRIAVLRLAESLGAETVTLDGPSAATALLEYVRTRGATRVIVGAPKRRGWRAWFRPSTATQLLHQARGFDVVIIAPPDIPTQQRASSGSPNQTATYQGTIHWDRYGWAVGLTVACTLLALAMYSRFELSNLAMIYLLGVMVAGLRLGRGPSALTAVLNVASFDFFCVPPRFTFAVSDAQYLVTFGTMLTIALVIATLTANVRQQTRVAGARERRTATLYAMSRELAVTRGIESMASVAIRHVTEVFQCKAVVLLPDASGKLQYPPGEAPENAFRHADLAVAQWVADHGRRAGLGSDTLPAAPALYVPLGDERRTAGVLAVLPNNPRRVLLPEQSHLLDTFAGQIGLALERARLAEIAEASSLAVERETLRNTLLASISHDLRTPLAVMAGAASTLAERGPTLAEESKAELARSIEVKAREMSDLVSNVLDLMRFQSGQVVLRRDWQPLEDLVGAALERLKERMQNHPVELRLPSDLPPVYVDAGLIVQLFGNLFDNIAKYTPPGTRSWVSATHDGESVRVVVEDEGPGFPAGDPAKLFDKFQRGNEEGAVVGAGLGLTICRAIVRAHGGEIEARRRDGQDVGQGVRKGGSKGARFDFTLPAREPPA
ncbi:MAG TPA: sensor histidine kinase KdpD [Steroidobacteraceae bacterium]|nr:sensor histidine kinase KdpD [Steroidobacteraceae bacterium]